MEGGKPSGLHDLCIAVRPFDGWSKSDASQVGMR